MHGRSNRGIIPTRYGERRLRLDTALSSRATAHSASRAITLSWPTLTAAADGAGSSPHNGVIHFEAGELARRTLGKQVGVIALQKAVQYWTGGGTAVVAGAHGTPARMLDA